MLNRKVKFLKKKGYFKKNGYNYICGYDRVKEKSFYSIRSSAVENKVDLPASSVLDQNSKNTFVVEGFPV
jgi:hypothetical protein